MIRWWRDLSVVKKLYAVVGLMAILIATELLTLLFAMTTLSSVRAFVAGEGLWTKSQKDAIHSLYQYALTGHDHYYGDFETYLRTNEGDHIAQLELLKPDLNFDVARRGFLQGGNDRHDIDGMIHLLVRFHEVSFLRVAIDAWQRADALVVELRKVAAELHEVILERGKNDASVIPILNQIAEINEKLEVQEVRFSSSLGAGSRWLEHLLMVILACTVFTVEATGIFLTFRFSRHLSQTLNELRTTAVRVGRGNFTLQAPVRTRDELGQLATALNKMIDDLNVISLERTRAEETLRKTDERFRLLVEAVNDYAIYILDTEGNVINWNSGAEKITGYSADEILGKNFSMFFTDEDRADDLPTKELEIAKRAGRFERDALRMRKDGSSFWANVLMTALYDAAGQLTGFSKVTRDISERKEIEVRLQKMNQELEKRVSERTQELKIRESELQKAKEIADVANATKSAFLANMSHEIRTPLGAILGFSEIITNAETSQAERAAGVEIIRRNGELLSNIVNDILDLSKVEAGKLEVEKIPTSLADVMAEFNNIPKLKASEKGIQLLVRTEGATPQFIVTDPLRLRQILLNIVGNALKFTDQGSVTVVVKMAQPQNPNLGQMINAKQLLTFIVTDTGRGLTPQQAKRLFSPFTQADPSTTRKFGGTGLGLVLSKKLATALGGDVYLKESSPGKGSTFVVTIDPGPQAQVNITAGADDASPPFAKTSQRSTVRTAVEEGPKKKAVAIAGRKVLVVDDSHDNQALVGHFLKKAGAEVETANNGKEGLERAFSGDFDVVLMDLQMPVMDGYESLKELRRRGYDRPVIAFTAHAMKEEQRRCLESGFNSHLSKPINCDLLLRTISQITES